MDITSLKWKIADLLKKDGHKERKKGVKSFSETRKKEDALDSMFIGRKSVPVEKIVGSVGRYHDFDDRFRLKEDREPYRLQRIKEAMRSKKPLPPVDLYKIKNEYYVLDGNHRVAAAKELGLKVIDANISEYLPSKETLENIIYREKADFESKTGLFDLIELTEAGQFSHLKRQITEHQTSMEQVLREPVSLKRAATDWYHTIFRPLVGIIKQSKLPQSPQRTLADLYVYISFHQWQKGRRKRAYGVGLDQLVPKSMESFRAKMMAEKERELPEMKRMATAFLLINVEASKENRIMKKLFLRKEVIEAHFIPGDFDILAKIEIQRDLFSSDSEVIGQFIQDKVRRIPGVVKTQTIIPIISKKKNTPVDSANPNM